MSIGSDGSVELTNGPNTDTAVSGPTADPGVSGSTAGPDGSTAGPDGPTAGPDGSTAGPDGSTAGPDGPSAGPDGSTADPGLSGPTTDPSVPSAGPESTTDPGDADDEGPPDPDLDFNTTSPTPLDEFEKETSPLELTIPDDVTTFGHDTSLFMFHLSILSRLAYYDEAMFLTQWKKIYSSQCVDPSFLTHYDGKPLLSEDRDIFTTPLPDTTFIAPENKSLDFMKLAKKVNLTLTESAFSDGKGTEGSQNCTLPSIDLSQDLLMVSIGTSNYKTTYVVCDKRHPEFTYVIFRGTASKKSSFAYNRPSSISPTTVDGDGYLYGIFKILMDQIHEIISAIKFIRTKLGNTPFRLIVTGHSIGGALASIFSYLYVKSIQHLKDNLTDEPITGKVDITFTEPTDPLTCVVFGTPRVFSKETANKFCQMVEQNKMHYRRVTTANDPVSGLPFKQLGYSHPCSDQPMQNKVYVECDKQITKLNVSRCKRPASVEFNYNQPVNCRYGKQTKKFKSIGKLLTDHMEYLGIGYSNAINVTDYFSDEIKKQFKSTSMRVGIYVSNVLKFAFVTLDKQRDNKKSMFGFKDTTSEDVRDTYTFMTELEKIAEPFGNDSPLFASKYYYNEHKGEEVRFTKKKGGKRKTRKLKPFFKRRMV
jgi:hypothetical protein